MSAPPLGSDLQKKAYHRGGGRKLGIRRNRKRKGAGSRGAGKETHRTSRRLNLNSHQLSIHNSSLFPLRTLSHTITMEVAMGGTAQSIEASRKGPGRGLEEARA